MKNDSPSKIFHQKSWLQRLFESDIFNISLAMQYLFTTKEVGIISYLGKYLNMNALDAFNNVLVKIIFCECLLT